VIELGKKQSLVATCARGLEKVLADELRELGADAVAPDRGSVLFSGDLRTVYDTNLIATLFKNWSLFYMKLYKVTRF